MKIPLIRPFLPEGTREAIDAVLDSGMLSEGPVTREFEAAVCDYLECRHAIATTSCTIGLEMALKALGVGIGDEVVVPDYTYPASALAIENVGATPVIVDINPNSMLLDLTALEVNLNPKTKAVMPVSLFGNSLDYSRLDALLEPFGVKVLEDAACAMGAEFREVKVGCRADITVFSTHPRKLITTGDGGIVTTTDRQIAEWIRSYKHFGMDLSGSTSGHLCDFVQSGTNGKISDLLSAIGLSQIRQADILLSRRRDLAANYLHLLAEIPGITFPDVTPHSRHAYQTFTLFVENRDAILHHMRAKGIEVQIGTYALHQQKAFRGYCEGKQYPGSDYAYSHCLALPLYHQMTSREQQNVVAELCNCIQ